MKKSPESKNNPLVSVIILNWNRPQDTLECVSSIKAQTYGAIETIVVDNGSIDDSKQILKKMNDITLVENPVNRGFTGGHIDGLKFANGEYVFVLNNDAVVDKNYVRNAVSILEKDSSIAVVGGRSYQWEVPEQMFKDAGPFLAFQTINRFSMEGIFERSDKGYDHEVNWVSGSAMVIRKSVLEESGYFYDPMFAYYEESDLFARIQAAGYTIVYSPSLKIWHKNGASSSSYFQYYQLFKNRFLYGVRNLNSKDLARFIRSYTRTTLRGSYHHLTRQANSDEEKIMNRALHDALKHSTVTWPKWVASRQTQNLIDKNGHSLKDRLKIEQTGISFVCDLSGNPKSFDKLASFIKEVSFRHYNSEIVFVCNNETIAYVKNLIDSNKVNHFNIKTVTDKNQSVTNPLNLGWLSASKEFVWFITPSYQPKIKDIGLACVAFDDNMRSFYRKNEHEVCMSRQILSLYGGLDTLSTATSTQHLADFAKMLPNTSVRDLVENSIKIAPEIIKKIKSTVHSHADQQRKTRRYTKLLERYYRLYQLHNLSTWLFVDDVPRRHKLARLRNTMLATIKLDRKELAIELKHMSNEVIKAKHSGFDRGEREAELSVKAEDSLKKNKWQSTPVFIICRDRVTPLKELVSWLESVGMNNIFFIDNDSIYPDLIKFYDSTKYQVIKTGKNVGHTVVWQEGVAKTLFPGQFYIVTDPDVIPDSKCPDDVIKHFYQLHVKYIDYQKVGFGLQTHDIPGHYKLKDHVINWESQFWKEEIEPNVFEAGVDTTFALYKPYTDYYFLHPSIRTGKPYTAKHLPWYIDSSKIDEEEAFYRMHASQDITSWNTDEILDRYKKEFLKK